MKKEQKQSRYVLQRYSPRSWAIRERESGRIVAYPGPKLATVAHSWLKWEIGEDGQTAENPADFIGLIDAAVQRITAELQRCDYDLRNI